MPKFNGLQYPSGNEKTVYDGESKMAFHFLKKCQTFCSTLIFTQLFQYLNKSLNNTMQVKRFHNLFEKGVLNHLNSITYLALKKQIPELLKSFKVKENNRDI